MSIDWGWELAVLPVVFLLLAAAIVAGDDEAEPEPEPGKRPVAWLALAVLAVPALAVLVVSLIGARGVLDSQAAFREGDYESALSSARTAGSAQPWAAGPVMQEALVPLRDGRARGGHRDRAGRQPSASPPTGRRGRPTAAIGQDAGDEAVTQEGYDRGKELNPRSPVYGGEG